MKVEVALRPLPLRALPDPRLVVPSKNSTKPVGVTPPLRVLVTVAVKVTAWLAADGLAELVTVVLKVITSRGTRRCCRPDRSRSP